MSSLAGFSASALLQHQEHHGNDLRWEIDGAEYLTEENIAAHNLFKVKLSKVKIVNFMTYLYIYEIFISDTIWVLVLGYVSSEWSCVFWRFYDKWAILLFPGIDREALCKIHLKTEAFDLAPGKKTWQLEKNSKITACCSLWYGKNTNGGKILFIKSAYCKDYRYLLVHESPTRFFMSNIFKEKFWDMEHLRQATSL